LYSQDLSNRKTLQATIEESGQFLYSQDLSNRKTAVLEIAQIHLFLYSQDLSNRKTLQTGGYGHTGFCTLKI